jgi:hypothetical protein
MLDSTIIIGIFSIYLLTFLIVLNKKRLKEIVIFNGLIAFLYSTVFFAISAYIDGRDSMIYNVRISNFRNPFCISSYLHFIYCSFQK